MSSRLPETSLGRRTRQPRDPAPRAFGIASEELAPADHRAGPSRGPRSPRQRLPVPRRRGNPRERLARRAQITKQSMAELVAHLERHGSVERVPDPADRPANWYAPPPGQRGLCDRPRGGRRDRARLDRTARREEDAPASRAAPGAQRGIERAAIARRRKRSTVTGAFEFFPTCTDGGCGRGPRRSRPASFSVSRSAHPHWPAERGGPWPPTVCQSGTMTVRFRRMLSRRRPGDGRSALGITCQTLGDLVLVGLRGELDVYTSPGFREHVRRYDPAEVQLAIDLTEVGLLDSAGLGGLISLRNEVHRAGRSLGLVCPRRELAACSGRRACAPPSCSGRTWRCFGLRLRTRSGDPDRPVMAALG